MRLCPLLFVAMLAAVLLCVGAAAPGAAPGPAEPLPLVTVSADGWTYHIRSASINVGDLLAELGIPLSPLDRTTPAPTAPLGEGLSVRVTRVTCRTVKEEAPLPAKTIVLAAPRRPGGYTGILEHGQDGRMVREVRVWEKDGQETLRAPVRETVVVKPKDTVILRGTSGLPSRGGDWRHPLRMVATAYDPGPRSCGRYADGYTATGAKAEKGVVATDPRVIPMGTRLYVPGYGFAVAADRGSAIKGMRIDLCFATYQEAKQFGRRTVEVYVLD